VAPLGYP